MQLYLNHRVLSFNWNKTTTLLRFGSNFNYMHGILYEIWWHTGLINISELNFLISDPFSCGCSSYCTTSPIVKCLPLYTSGFNSNGIACNSSCTTNNQSCHIDSTCISMTNPSCENNLYSKESNSCILHCPSNSCNCTNKPFSCSCKSGFKLVPGSSYACIPNTWPDYNVVDFKYTIKCSEGYTPGCNGDCCVCDTGYIPIKDNPLKCGFDTLRCREYTEGDTLFTCTSCETGYTLGCDGKCCECDEGYINVVDRLIQQVSNNPTICIPPVHNCEYYQLYDNQYACAVCTKGYALDRYNGCNLCDEGYEETSSNPFICKELISNCDAYSYTSDSRKCERCNEGFKLSESGVCDQCNDEYVPVIRGTLRCYESIPRCIEYYIAEDSFRCSICEMEYNIDNNGRCDECSIDNTKVQEIPLVCGKMIDYCKEYTLKQDEIYCKECESDLILKNQTKCGCRSGLYFDQSLCRDCPQGCSECILSDLSLECTTCESGYQLQTKNSKQLCYEAKDQNEKLDNTETTDEYSSYSFFISRSHIIIQTVIAVTSVLSILSLNFNTLFQLLGTTQILSYILLYNLSLPHNINAVLKGITFFEVIPNIFKYFASNFDDLGNKRFERMDYYNEVFLLNSGKTLTIFIITALFYIILKIIHHIAAKNSSIETFRRLSSRVIYELEWSFFIGFIIEVTLEITTTSLISIKYASFDNWYRIMSLVVSIICLVIYI
jgi:hypothetical protein